jgi:transposase-like protein
MDRVSEIISRVERRRKWTAEQKVKILAEALEPGATVSAVAQRNGVSRRQLYDAGVIRCISALRHEAIEAASASSFRPLSNASEYRSQLAFLATISFSSLALRSNRGSREGRAHCGAEGRTPTGRNPGGGRNDRCDDKPGEQVECQSEYSLPCGSRTNRVSHGYHNRGAFG